MPGKKINQLPFLGNPNNEGMIPLEYSGTTYHIKFSSVTQNISDNILYTGKDINCLKIKSGMSLTQTIESIGDVLCINNSTVNPCFNLLIQEEITDPINYLLNLTISSWCNANTPYECNGENPIKYLFDLIYETWQNENIPYECSGTNPMEYFFDFSYNKWLSDNPPYECSGTNPMEYFFDFCYTVWNNE